ncbi:hypothetical protein, partial [Enterobacter intestinihominis]
FFRSGGFFCRSFLSGSRFLRRFGGRFFLWLLGRYIPALCLGNHQCLISCKYPGLPYPIKITNTTRNIRPITLAHHHVYYKQKPSHHKYR